MSRPVQTGSTGGGDQGGPDRRRHRGQPDEAATRPISPVAGGSRRRAGSGRRPRCRSSARPAEDRGRVRRAAQAGHDGVQASTAAPTAGTRAAAADRTSTATAASAAATTMIHRGGNPPGQRQRAGQGERGQYRARLTGAPARAGRGRRPRRPARRWPGRRRPSSCQSNRGCMSRSRRARAGRPPQAVDGGDQGHRARAVPRTPMRRASDPDPQAGPGRRRQQSGRGHGQHHDRGRRRRGHGHQPQRRPGGGGQPGRRRRRR